MSIYNDSHFAHGFQGFLSTAMILQRRNINKIGSNMAIRPGGRPPMIKNDQMSNRRHELREREGGKKGKYGAPRTQV